MFSPARSSTRQAQIDRSLEWLKWLALLLMTGDHVNAVFFDRQFSYLSEAARICFPLFACILAYNLRRPGVDAYKTMTRLILWGLVAQPWHALAFGQLLPLNVLFTFALGIYVCTTNRMWAAMLAWAIGGMFVDYQWFGVGVMVAFCMLMLHGHRYPVRFALLFVASLASLYFITGNLWALAALPVACLAIYTRRSMPRLRWAFYWYYPAHFVALAVLSRMFS